MDKYGYVTLAIGVILIILALLPITISEPDTWLKEWTTWLASYVALVVAARSVWNIMDSLAARIRGGNPEKRTE